ncbi:TenA family transcriptional regulator [Metallosphaera sedula]|uniref:TenA family transcriptional regulator n=1 Tax=Metallosphaera prunae TaxID=47304 RepID=A0A4D8RWM8_METPR|nr:C2H2 type zinc finger domain-containing protein [Metallosphaera prunae]QCO29346.1 TenA family transcriptional regulator [Metallosphaera prunae]
MPICPACEIKLESWGSVSSHMIQQASRSDPGHVMWLNRNLSLREMPQEELAKRLETFFSGELRSWIISRFIEKFYGDKPHPFMIAMQNPTREVLLGYVLEHQHFLVNWVRVLSKIVYETDQVDVIRFELENITTEFVGTESSPSHYELLLRMGESMGMKREEILSTPPLKGTVEAINTWRKLSQRNWVEVMAAMHSLELVADKNLRRYGAKIHYFNEKILDSNDFPEAVKNFLMEGYEADQYHAEEALDLVERYAVDQERVKVTVLKSFDTFSKYLLSRLERALLLSGVIA